MMIYTITVGSFLEWYYNYGQDQENTELRMKLAETMLDQLFKTGQASITAQEIFDGCNQEAIRVNYLEEFKNTDIDQELSDVLVNYEVKLIN